ncbi:NAD-dependent epimerase/dehydratase family protein [Yoonia sp. SS1-5]|uniref:NAD-dependent epimerase/dehydratase family protein n=1 Tax=Yoonia rhodophyticola TaxID=3137370 RepID=A0AAN0MDC8_9RHOB
MTQKEMRVGLIGAGYIASRHASAVELNKQGRVTAVCDVSETTAREFAGSIGAQPYTSVDDMIAAGVCDIVHILTPPHTHAPLAIQCLNAGLHVFVEKPFALSRDEAAAILAAEEASAGQIAVCHNFLGLPSYAKLKKLVADGSIGRIDTVEVNWRFPLTPLRSGPYNLWMLREPQNLLFEIGPHLFAFATDLGGALTDIQVSTGKPITLPGNLGVRHQTWRVLAKAGSIDVAINISLVEGVDDRSVYVRGTNAVARLDYAQDTLNMRYENAAELVISPLSQQLSQAGQNIKNGAVNAAKQLTSLNRKNPYDLSFTNTVQAIYTALSANKPMDARFSGDAAATVVKNIAAVVNSAPAAAIADIPAAPAGSPNPTVLVVGGTGFIGRHLTRSLVASGRDVRVLSRGAGGPFSDLSDRVEMFAASLKDAESLEKAMQGIDVVYHLAKSDNATWEGYLENDIGVTERLAEAAMKAGVKRFIYTGTIASYDMSDPAQTITEASGFGDDIESRNLYARAKALSEERLMDMHQLRGLPLVIARPGIVIGEGGPLQHWGIGKWNGAGAVQLWGNGKNILPFVLIDDVSDALIKMIDRDDILGKDYNLIGEPMMTGRGYFDAIHQSMNARLRVKSSSFIALHLIEKLKYTLKKNVLRKRNLSQISLADWKSRGHLSPFDNSKAKADLDWQPVRDKDEFIRRAIVEANLFGF